MFYIHRKVGRRKGSSKNCDVSIHMHSYSTCFIVAALNMVIRLCCDTDRILTMSCINCTNAGGMPRVRRLLACIQVQSWSRSSGIRSVEPTYSWFALLAAGGGNQTYPVRCDSSRPVHVTRRGPGLYTWLVVDLACTRNPSWTWPVHVTRRGPDLYTWPVVDLTCTHDPSWTWPVHVTLLGLCR